MRSVKRRASKKRQKRGDKGVVDESSTLLDRGARWVGTTAGRVANRVLPRATASDRRRQRGRSRRRSRTSS